MVSDWLTQTSQPLLCPLESSLGALHHRVPISLVYLLRATGKGIYVWPDGRHYEGDFFENNLHGQGLFKDVQGHVWTGQFFNGSGPGLTMRITQP